MWCSESESHPSWLQDVAERISREARDYGLPTKCAAMDAYSVQKLPSQSHIIFIASTTGQASLQACILKLWQPLLCLHISAGKYVQSLDRCRAESQCADCSTELIFYMPLQNVCMQCRVSILATCHTSGDFSWGRVCRRTHWKTAILQYLVLETQVEISSTSEVLNLLQSSATVSNNYWFAI